MSKLKKANKKILDSIKTLESVKYLSIDKLELHLCEFEDSIKDVVVKLNDVLAFIKKEQS